MFLTTWAHHWETLPLASNLMWTLDTPSYKGVEDAARIEKRLKEYIARFPTGSSKP